MDDAYPCRLVETGAGFTVPGAELVRAVADDLRAGVPRDVVAARFHNAVARVVADGCALIRTACGLSTVALSGGVFQNLLLLGRAVTLLEERGFTVLTHHRVPPNDGGVSLGQAAVAAAMAANSPISGVRRELSQARHTWLGGMSATGT